MSRPTLASPTMLKLMRMSSATPAAAKTSASPTFWQVMPAAPAAICIAAIAGILWVLMCGRFAMPASATRRWPRAMLAARRSRSIVTQGVSSASTASGAASGCAVMCDTCYRGSGGRIARSGDPGTRDACRSDPAGVGRGASALSRGSGAGRPRRRRRRCRRRAPGCRTRRGLGLGLSSWMVLPEACSSASSRLRATLTRIVASTSGCSETATGCRPSSLIGWSRTTWRRSSVKPPAVAASAMSRVVTEP